MPGKALRPGRPKITSPWPLAWGGHFFWKCPRPGPLPYTRRIPFELMGYQTNTKEWVSPQTLTTPQATWKQSCTMCFFAKISCPDSVERHCLSKLNCPCYKKQPSHCERWKRKAEDISAFWKMETKGRRISQHFERWKRKAEGYLSILRDGNERQKDITALWEMETKGRRISQHYER